MLSRKLFCRSVKPDGLHDLLYTQASFTGTSEPGGVLDFSGSGQKFTSEVNDQLNFALCDFEISFNIYAPTGGGGKVFQIGNSGSNYAVYCNVIAGQVIFGHWAANFHVATTNSPVLYDQWFKVSIRRAGSLFTMKVNDVAVLTWTNSNSMGISGTWLTLGTGYDTNAIQYGYVGPDGYGYGGWFKGKLKDFKIRRN